MTQSNYQQLEHQTGLILSPVENQVDNNNLQDAQQQPTDHQIEALAKTTIKSNVTIEALRALRDSNPSLLNKLTFKAKENHFNYDDACVEYWNSVQDVISLNEDDHSLKCLNLGGLMVRIKTMIPFVDILKKYNAANKLEVVNLGGTDVLLSNLLQAVRFTDSANKNEEKSSEEESVLFRSLQRLYISGCGISSQHDGIDHLCSIVKSMPNLTTLDLRYNDLQKPLARTNDKEDMNNSLKNFFQDTIPQSKIEALHLEGNNLNDDLMSSLSDALAKTTSLKELYLGSNKIEAKGAELIASGLKSNQTLEKLYLEGNFIGDQGLEHFCLLLEGKQQIGINKEEDGKERITSEDDGNFNVLEKLWVENNGVGKDMMKRFGKALQGGRAVVDL